jgi:HEPN domain-containing protein
MSDPKLVDEWAQKAEGDFQTATRMMRWRKKPQLDSVCYHCQQCAEKYVKAFLVQHDVAFPWIHNLPIRMTLALRLPR